VTFNRTDMKTAARTAKSLLFVFLLYLNLAVIKASLYHCFMHIHCAEYSQSARAPSLKFRGFSSRREVNESRYARAGHCGYILALAHLLLEPVQHTAQQADAMRFCMNKPVQSSGEKPEPRAGTWTARMRRRRRISMRTSEGADSRLISEASRMLVD
jgi:hypothetical protein